MRLCVCVQNISKSYRRILMIYLTKNAYVLGTYLLLSGEDPNSFVDPGSFSTFFAVSKVTFCSVFQQAYLNTKFNVTYRKYWLCGRKIRNSLALVEICSIRYPGMGSLETFLVSTDGLEVHFSCLQLWCLCLGLGLERKVFSTSALQLLVACSLYNVTYIT